tara:strand:- start:286 stop:651 length:366 start_codon:yes stop_codon:yes gene_type:complete
MATAVDIMAGGFSAGQAQAINGQVNSTATAAGTTQGTATTITASITTFTTVAALSGAVLTDSMIGDEYVLLNLGANALAVYPPSGAQIHALGANNPIFLAPNTALKLRKFTATRWAGFLSA